VYFHLLAAYVEQGYRLNQALEKVPHFLPPQINATLKAGEEMGDIEKVLPACRRILADGASDSQTTQNNLMVLLFPFPIAPLLIWGFSIWVAPKIKAIAVDMLGAFPSWSEQMFRWSAWLAALALLLWIAIWVGTCIHIGGPRFVRWLEAGLWPLSHRLNFWIPWRHKRMQRDFSVMLALLLDADVPEEKAVRLAAHSTANRIFTARAERVAKDLRQGINLTEALQRLDDTREFRWRLQNAIQPHGSFLNALAGWHEALEAKAYQQEQAFSQIITTGFVCLNGVTAALVAIGLFRILLAIVEEAPLW
jgi:type II secretory pathway component PulF